MSKWGVAVGMSTIEHEHRGSLAYEAVFNWSPLQLSNAINRLTLFRFRKGIIITFHALQLHYRHTLAPTLYRGWLDLFHQRVLAEEVAHGFAERTGALAMDDA